MGDHSRGVSSIDKTPQFAFSCIGNISSPTYELYHRQASTFASKMPVFGHVDPSKPQSKLCPD